MNSERTKDKRQLIRVEGMRLLQEAADQAERGDKHLSFPEIADLLSKKHGVPVSRGTVGAWNHDRKHGGERARGAAAKAPAKPARKRPRSRGEAIAQAQQEIERRHPVPVVPQTTSQAPQEAAQPQGKGERQPEPVIYVRVDQGAKAARLQERVTALATACAMKQADLARRLLLLGLVQAERDPAALMRAHTMTIADNR